MVYPSYITITYQKLLHKLLQPLFNLIFKYEVVYSKDLKISTNKSYVFISNHHTRIDPYLVLAALPYQDFKKLLPIYLLTANTFLKHWWQRFALEPQGSIPAQQISGKLSGVLGAMELVEKNCSILIFPEGKRQPDSIYRASFNSGVAVLAKYKKIELLPIHIDNLDKKITVKYGKSFNMKSQVFQPLEVLVKKIEKKYDQSIREL